MWVLIPCFVGVWVCCNASCFDSGVVCCGDVYFVFLFCYEYTCVIAFVYVEVSGDLVAGCFEI